MRHQRLERLLQRARLVQLRTRRADTRLASICGVVANLGRVPLAAVLASTLGLGVTGVWLSISLSTMLKAPLKWACFSRTSRKT